MPRSSNSPATRKRRKKVLDKAKGFWGRRKSLYKTAKETVQRGEVFAYAHRRQKKRTMRSLWIIRINAAVREHGLSYSVFMNLLKSNQIEMNRKSLAHLAAHDHDAFEKLVQSVKPAAQA